MSSPFWTNEKQNLESERADIRKQDCDEQQFHASVRIPFLEKEEKLENRFENVEIISHLGSLAVSVDILDSLPPVYREESLRQLATYFELDEIMLLEEWVQWLEVLKNLEFPDLEGQSSLPVLAKLLRQSSSLSSQDLVRIFRILDFCTVL